MNASFHTLGCRLNQADSATVADDLARHGFQIVPFGEPADLVVINSCSVTATASQKTRQALRNARKHQPDAFIVLMGCDATVADMSSFPDADMIVPNPRPAPLSQLLPVPLVRTVSQQRFTPGVPADDFTCEGTGLFAEKTRANLKVQEGCDFFCTYCIVPYSRGPARSRNLDDVLREARQLIERGHREIVLSGVNITTYNNSGADLADLMERLLDLHPEVRYRLGSAEPGPVVHKVVKLMTQTNRICRFLHLPLQYGEDSILSKMNRHYDTRQFRDLVFEANESVPDICFGTDVIVGFPGETDETFDKCLAYITSLPFGLMHVFTYSPRQGTPAAEMPGRPDGRTAERRSACLLKLAEQKARLFAEANVGKTLEVLIENTSPPSGWSDNYLQVTIEDANSLPQNSLHKVKIISTGDDRNVIGRLNK
ncbi:MAG: tRNA (N(6)-L-threonylcarbamoyladenosine(37)-C(2))-methylthiotransferase MtaB [Victivallales bacterium]|nr:tRNA (N(6)-L-threonylcarbamoyladenosine(37)-C(2))-methylthiotransferase MtaB [Victivallales bacterium]